MVTQPLVQVKLNLSKLLELLSKGVNPDGTITINVPTDEVSLSTDQRRPSLNSQTEMKRQQLPKFPALPDA
ncbi:hypothetical protein EB796_011381 [Bugula neritina]|uniref:Uncharacterized protein n=1 Tax=Bugula neritina TaxID=10212 RepID=A0A7J7JX91_BUGNE|nr:hypothetical protein EB796_011381 [Bugula neritina]